MSKITKFILLIGCTIVLIFILHLSMKNLAQQQNRLNLLNIEKCLTYTHGLSPNINTKNLMNICAGNVRSLGITGDVFLMRMSDKKLYWDASLDCKPDSENKLFMTRNGVCSLFNEPDTCLSAVNHMMSLGFGEISWKFDDSTEWLSFSTIFINGDIYKLVQGAQEDEISSNFIYFNIFLFAVIILFSFVILFTKKQ